MKYTSTRSDEVCVSFEEALCSGYSSKDGGLFVPERLPSIDIPTLSTWSKFSFSELAYNILRLFISPAEISDAELDSICDASFRQGFDETLESTVPVKKIGQMYVAELFHGPTQCFKDLGMRVVVKMLSHFATKSNRSITLLVSTTGDTGPAACQAVSDANNRLMTLLVHYPNNQISAYQRKQLTTANSPYVHVVSFEGGGDDMDEPIKRILASSGYLQDSPFFVCGVNSFNIGRPLAQIVHFFWTYFRVVELQGLEIGSLIDIVIPTGAMGNVTGAMMAKKMGLPFRKLCTGVNINDIVHRTIQNGKFYKSANMEKTMSEAINVQVPYNFERILYYLTNNGDHQLVKSWMEQMEDTQKLDIESSILTKLQATFSSARVSDQEMCDTMVYLKEKFDYTVDPHTAVAVNAATKLGYRIDDGTNEIPFAVLSTASPCKFEEVVTSALGKLVWEDYKKNHYPKKALEIEIKVEQPPTIYQWKDGLSLEEVQKQWEQQARDLIIEEFL